MGWLCRKRTSVSAQGHLSMYGSLSRHGSRIDGRVSGSCVHGARCRREYVPGFAISAISLLPQRVLGEYLCECNAKESSGSAHLVLIRLKSLKHWMLRRLFKSEECRFETKGNEGCSARRCNRDESCKRCRSLSASEHCATFRWRSGSEK